MRRQQLLLFTLVAAANALFISEYAEGSAQNRYIEIFNEGIAAVELTSYAFPTVFNTPDTPGEHENWNTLPAGASVAAGGVYVICNPNVAGAISSLCDYSTSAISHTGDDAICLAQGTESNHTILDCVGE